MLLLFIIMVMALVPYYLPEKPVELEILQPQLVSPPYAENPDQRFPAVNRSRAAFHSTTSSSFPFDPNTLDERGWKKLGVRDKTIGTIQKFLQRGGKFRQPADIRKIYGLSAKEADRLEPFVSIPASNKVPIAESFKSKDVTRFQKSDNAARSTGKIIEINEADSAAFESLPGIGYKLASRIILFRNRLGGFYSITQVAETYGLQDSTFQKIRRYLICDTSKIQLISINTVNSDELKQHPYIRWQLAKLIVEYRNQHGKFRVPEDLLRVEGIRSETLEKLRPYLRL